MNISPITRMMPSKWLSIFLMLVMFLASVPTTNATEVIGGSLTYKQVGGPQSLTYQLVVEVYTKCSNLPPQRPTVGINYGKCGAAFADSRSNPSLVRLIQTNSGVNEHFTSSVSAAQKCSGFNVSGYPVYPGQVQTFTFTYEVTLPSREPSWYFWARTIDQRSQITSPADASNLPVYLEATLNNLAAQQNNGPSFLIGGNPVGFPERGPLQLTAFAATDPDQDSLAYEFDSVAITCNQAAKQYQLIDTFLIFDTSSIPVRFAVSGGNLSVKNPIASFLFNQRNPQRPWQFGYTGVYLNEHTGDFAFGARYSNTIAFRDQLKEVFVATVKVKKFRRLNGQMTLIGTVVKEVNIEPVASRSRDDMMFDTVSIKQSQPTLDLRIKNPADIQIIAFRGGVYNWTLPFVNQGDSAIIINLLGSLPQGLSASVVNNQSKNAVLELRVDARNPNLPHKLIIPIEVISNNFPLLRKSSYSLQLELLAPIPAPRLNTNSQVVNCAGSAVNLSAPAGLEVIYWSTGQVGNSILVYESGQYYAFLKLPTGGIVKSEPLTVNFAPPIQPVLQDDNGLLVTAAKAGATYNWMIDGQVVATTVTPSYMPTKDGFYKVQVQIGNCSETSDYYKVDYTTFVNRKLDIYPNPGRDVITLAAPKTLWDQSRKVMIYSVTGQLVATYDVTPEKTSSANLNISKLIPGAYQLRFEGTGIVKNFVKW